MKEKILKLINNHCILISHDWNEYRIKDKNDLAKEIITLIESNYYPKEFVKWYSGMESEKIERAFIRWKTEVKDKI